MKASKVFKEIGLVFGITLFLWVAIFATFLISSPYSFRLKDLIPHGMFWAFSFSIFIGVLTARVLLVFTSRLKWKYAGGLLAIIISVMAGIEIQSWSCKFYVKSMLKPHWQTYKNDSYRVVFESPYSLHSAYGWEFSRGMGSRSKKDSRGVLIHSESPFSLIQIYVHCEEFKDHLPSLDYEKSSLQEKLGNGKVTPAVCSGMPALLADGDQSVKVIIVKGKFEWTFDVHYKNYWYEYCPTDTKQMADRVIQSIKIGDLS